MARVCVIDLPGLSLELLASVPEDSALGKWLAGKTKSGLTPSWPAVTCSVQATLTTGTPPSKHGIVANGVATFRSTADQDLVDASNYADYRKQVSFWEQSNQFLRVPRFWQNADGSSRYKTALLFFQNSMPGFTGTQKSSADIVLTPKPDHGPDGKLTSLCWSNPPELVPALFKELGPFPLMNYWGPMAGIASSTWIAKSAAMVWKQHQPQLQWVYVPHLDYDLQRFGPASPQATKAVVDVAGALEPLLSEVLASGGKIVLLSEYSISAVSNSISPNQLLRAAGLLVTRQTADGELIDYENSKAVAMVDHQIAHIYLKDPASKAAALKALANDSIEILADASTNHIGDTRGGDIQIQAKPGTWFDYRWWTDPTAAPVFAGTVDIHRKPGYDPLELFFDMATRSVITDASRIKGSHGNASGSEGIFVSDEAGNGSVLASEVAGKIIGLLG